MFYSNCCWAENFFNKMAQILTSRILQSVQLLVRLRVSSSGIICSTLWCFLTVCRSSLAARTYLLLWWHAVLRWQLGLPVLSISGGLLSLESIQGRAAKMGQGLEGKEHEKRLRFPGLFSPEKRNSVEPGVGLDDSCLSFQLRILYDSIIISTHITK